LPTKPVNFILFSFRTFKCSSGTKIKASKLTM
jgi:hypothetical protein